MCQLTSKELSNKQLLKHLGRLQSILQDPSRYCSYDTDTFEALLSSYLDRRQELAQRLEQQAEADREGEVRAEVSLTSHQRRIAKSLLQSSNLALPTIKRVAIDHLEDMLRKFPSDAEHREQLLSRYKEEI